MAKDSQLDPNPIRKQKSKGGPTMAESALDGERRKAKKKAINEISKGTFDDFKSGEEIVIAIANDKTLLSDWK